MKCPFCGHLDQKVLDSRVARESEVIRRRRECLGCGRRFTTFEAPEKPRLYVIKRDGRREEFDSEKILSGMLVACRKRSVSLEVLRQAVARIERELFDIFESEVSFHEIGERVMRELCLIDPVAYVRFASVYKTFESPEDFKHIVDSVQ